MSSLLLRSFLLVSAVVAADAFDWDSISSADALSWTACYDAPLECARLSVPLDYTTGASRAESVGNASLALVRFPANVSANEYRGPILFNPGGPGESGVSAIVSLGASFAGIFGAQFDIVGFDPRGVGYSTPGISFFATAAERAALIPNPPAIVYPSLNATPNAVGEGLAGYQLLGLLAEQNDAATGGVLRYMTTDNAARDMLSIARAFGFEKVQYWGVSYGSMLGQTFATLFPENVGRVIIDGVFDADTYYNSDQASAVVDLDKAVQAFFDGCASAGPAACPFTDGNSTSADLSDKFAQLGASIMKAPIPLLTTGSRGIFTYSALRNTFLDALFAPYQGGFSFLAQGLAALASPARNASLLYGEVQAPIFECTNEAEEVFGAGSNLEAYIAIACGDAFPVEPDLDALEAYYRNATQVSSFGDLLANVRLVCAGYNIRRNDTFRGPIGANTSTPILLVGNTIDPATPLAGAQKTSTRFPGSVVLTFDAIGHTSLTAPSACVAEHLRAYMLNGTLPKEGTVCQIDEGVDTELFPAL
ncbi:hypothetical protein HMN09_00726200 [Mycena chlorophos]|uniref:AB hydrolase-1 domain-containing protein n=1 Tax=Mycena chlorophos TaxID=658473 RepID=A0A8H6W4S6_MYCCL|nr:hypothetical protein HMN09_00726200 [Mycena chlorophos]